MSEKEREDAYRKAGTENDSEVPAFEESITEREHYGENEVSMMQERKIQKDDIIYELTDIVDVQPGEGSSDHILNDEIVKRISEISERVAREMFPKIAEKIIREEIEKLKQDVDEE